MALILNIESATRNCSVAISENGSCLALVEESAEKYIHAEKIHEFIEEALRKAGKKFNVLQAVAVSNGPGSYTGLRIGISAAKGFCYALNIPLIALNTNDILIDALPKQQQADFFLSVIDARRNEVYARLYNAAKEPISAIEAVELTAESYPDLANQQVCLVGDAATKTAEILDLNTYFTFQMYPSAAAMGAGAERAFANSEFADVAYHEPFYLKDFIAGKPKKML